MTPLRATCDPGAVPWLHTHSCCAESALFQGLILNPCFSHPPQACPSFFFSLSFFFLFYSCFLQLPALLSRQTNYFTSASTSPYAALEEEIQRASPALLFLLISPQIKQLTPCRALYSYSVPCCSVGNKSSRIRFCCNQLTEVAGTERSFPRCLTAHSVYPDNHLDP